MAVTNYYTVNGAILGEKTTGSNRVDYLTDALGSVTATVDQSANVVNTYRYKPYGAQLAKTGAGSDPAFRWVGSQGYRQTGKSYSDVYIRRRHYSSEVGRWTTKDPIRMKRWIPGDPKLLVMQVGLAYLNGYIYCHISPTNKTDPTGYSPTYTPCKEGWGECRGDVPRGRTCNKLKEWAEKAGGTALGGTSCNFLTGRLYSLICDPSCDAPCTKVHEEKHWDDFTATSCCTRARRCYFDLSHPAEECTDAWNGWYDAIEGWLECRAHWVGHACSKGLWNEKCLGWWPGHFDMEKMLCCVAIQLHMSWDLNVFSSVPGCRDPKWREREKPNPDCPFDENGKIKPRPGPGSGGRAMP